ncbi:MAG: hypothetical protein WDZ49_03645, partial [Litorilinea sp.]
MNWLNSGMWVNLPKAVKAYHNNFARASIDFLPFFAPILSQSHDMADTTTHVGASKAQAMCNQPKARA